MTARVEPEHGKRPNSDKGGERGNTKSCNRDLAETKGKNISRLEEIVRRGAFAREGREITSRKQGIPS